MAYYLKNSNISETTVNFYPPSPIPPIKGKHLERFANGTAVQFIKDVEGGFVNVSCNGLIGVVNSSHLQRPHIAGYRQSLQQPPTVLIGVGQQVEYESTTWGKWMPARVLGHNANGTYILDIHPQAPAHKVRSPVSPAPTPVGVVASLQKLTIGSLLEPSHKELLEMKIQMLFKEFAGANELLEYNEVENLVYVLAAQLGLPHSELGDILAMFQRYDFSGDGHLNEVEGVMMIRGLLRKMRDEKSTSSTIDAIPYKQYQTSFRDVRKLGEGAFGEVWLAVDKTQGNQERAVKKYRRAAAQQSFDEIYEEFTLLTDIDHQNIARNFEIFQDSAMIYLISEPYHGGDLTKLKESAAAHRVQQTPKWWTRIWQQVCAGVSYLHQKHVIHCDIKENNVMIASDDWEEPHIIIIDFGISQHFVSEDGGGGTPGYIPPEVWEKGLWTAKGDVFSTGVLIFKSLTDTLPFGQDVLERAAIVPGVDVIDGLRQAALSFVVPPRLGGTEYSKLNDLLQSMLARDFHKRPNFKRILFDPWFQENGFGGSPVNRFAARRFTQAAVGAKHVLHVALLRHCAAQQNLAQNKDDIDLWRRLDCDADGSVTPAEIRKTLQGAMAQSDLEALLKALAPTGGCIEFSDFMAYMVETKGLSGLFSYFDVDNSQLLDRGEIEKIASLPKVQDLLPGLTGDLLMKELDKDKDGKVSFPDFITAMQSPLIFLGHDIEYKSRTTGVWQRAQIVNRRADGCIMLSVRPGEWLDKKFQATNIRQIQS